MKQGEERAALEALAETVIGAAYEVSNVLGAGFMEKVCERALLQELMFRGVPAATETPLLVEVKCVDSFSNEHLAQCINCLKA